MQQRTRRCDRDGNLTEENSFTENFDNTMVVRIVRVVMDVRVRGGRKLQGTDPNNTPRQHRAQQSCAGPKTAALEQRYHQVSFNSVREFRIVNSLVQEFGY